MSEKKAVKATVENLVGELKNNASNRFSKSDFQTLIFAVLSDKDFKAKKYLLKNDDLVSEEYSINASMEKFVDKLLKHAGVAESSERAKIIADFEYSPKDVEWVADAVDEAMFIYSESGKNMRMFRDKMLQLTVQKMTRSGKYDGKVTYKKKVVDRAAALAKSKGKAKKAA